jgi:hypothetical protein
MPPTSPRRGTPKRRKLKAADDDDFRDVIKSFPPFPPVAAAADTSAGTGKRRRGRPPSDPAAGAASMAARAASHRDRISEEINALVLKLWFAMDALEKLGDLETIGRMFWAEDGAALNAAIRYNPERAADMEDMELRAKALKEEFHRRHTGAPPKPGPPKGSIQVGNSVFEIHSTGVVLRDGTRTNLRINAEHRCWIVVEMSYDAGPRRCHWASGGGRRGALLDAAMLLIERDRRESDGPSEALKKDWERIPPRRTW